MAKRRSMCYGGCNSVFVKGAGMRVACPRCAKSLNIPDAVAGQVGQCPGCSAKFRLPAARPNSPPSLPSSSKKSASAPVSSVTAKSPARPSATKGTADERRSRTAVDRNAPRSRKSRVQETDDDDEELTFAERDRSREDDDEEDEKHAKAQRRRRDRRQRQTKDFTWGSVYLGLFAFYGVDLLLALMVGLLSSFGAIIFLGLMSNVGFILMMIGGIMMLVVAFRNDVMDGLFCIIIPFYGLYYLLNHYDELRRWFYLNLFGGLYFGTSLIAVVILISAGAQQPNAAIVVQAPQPFEVQGQVPAVPPQVFNPQIVNPQILNPPVRPKAREAPCRRR